MRLFSNTFKGYREVKGYSQNEILSVKKKLTAIKIENINSEKIDDFLRSEFKIDVFNSYSEYFTEIRKFSESYLFSGSIGEYSSLKQEIINELKLITSNITNLNSNGRNIKRTIKNNEFLDEFLKIGKELQNNVNDFIPILEKKFQKIGKHYNNNTLLWTEANKIKNLAFKLSDIPSNLRLWVEIQELETYLRSLVEAKSTKKNKSRKNILLSFHFNELHSFFLSKFDDKSAIYNDFIYMLYNNKILEEYEGDKFLNILERKESIENLKTKMRPIVIELVKEVLGETIREIKELDQKYDLNGQGVGKFNLEDLMTHKFTEILPKIVDLYFKGMDKQFQEGINNISDPEEFVKIINLNYKKVDDFATKIDEIDTWMMRFDTIIKPYTDITANLKKTLANIISEVIRRKEEYLNYLNNIKDESFRVDVKILVDSKIAEVKKIITSYENETSLIMKEELPQLKQIRDLLSNYKLKIDEIKTEVYDKLDSYKENNIDLYSTIKHWEDNFNRKKNQLSFLLTVLMNKIFKSFKELIDTESILFAEITEITKQTENFEGLPFNFALSSFLADRLSEDELRERITEITSKTNQITSSLGLYELERSKLEEILTTKVKIRQGVSISNVQCTVCHKNINFVKDKLITCPFCGSTYHYLCVADWLSKHNSCPMCQNTFLDPNLRLFDTE
ncbi:MAG: RING finger domain-containing protein [Promethearchaeota archaeon]